MDNTGTNTPRLDLLGPIYLSENFLDAYIAHLLLPIIPVTKKKGSIPSILNTNRQILKVDHAPKTPFKRIQSSTGEKLYNCTEKGLEEPVSVEDQEVLGGRAEEVAAVGTTHGILRSRENSVATALTDAVTNFSGAKNTPASNAWSAAGGTPIDDVAAAKAALAKRGVLPNTLAFGYGVYQSLQTNTQIRSQVRAILGINKADAVNIDLDPNLLARVFGVKQVLVARATANSAKEGQAESMGFIWPSTAAILCRTPEGAGDSNLMDVCVGRTFMYDVALEVGDMAQGIQQDALRGFLVEEYRDNHVRANVIRSMCYDDTNILNSDAGQVLSGL